MQVTDRILGAVAAAPLPDGTLFATRQPGMLRYLEARFRPGCDALAVALEAAARIHLAFELVRGVPPDRVPSPLLERAEAALLVDGAEVEVKQASFSVPSTDTAQSRASPEGSARVCFARVKRAGPGGKVRV